MESFIIRLFQQMMNPSFVPVEYPQALQVPGHASHHSRNSSYCLQYETSLNPFSYCHGLFVVVGEEIVASSNGPNAVIGNPVFDAVGFDMLYFDFAGGSFRINIMGHSMIGVVINSLPPGQNIIKCFQFFHELSGSILCSIILYQLKHQEFLFIHRNRPHSLVFALLSTHFCTGFLEPSVLTHRAYSIIFFEPARVMGLGALVVFALA